MTSTANTDRMAAIRALRGKVPDVTDLLTVEKLERSAKWHIQRGGGISALLGCGQPVVYVDIGEKKASRRVFAYRNGVRQWNVVFGDGIGVRARNQSRNSQPGYTICEYVRGDGSKVNVYSFMQKDRGETYSARALATGPFTLDGSGSDQRKALRQIRNCSVGPIPDGTNGYCYLSDRFNKGDFSLSRPTALVGHEEDAEWVLDTDTNQLHPAWTNKHLAALGLFKQSTPPRDYADLGFTSDLAGWHNAVVEYYANDTMNQANAMELGLKAAALAESLQGVQLDYLWPGRYYTGLRWNKAYEDNPGSVDQTGLRQGCAPTYNMYRALYQSPGVNVPPCLLLTMPVYSIRTATLAAPKCINTRQDFMDGPPKVKQILLYPVRSGITPYVNQDTVDNDTLTATETCNFGSKNSYVTRGPVIPLEVLRAPHAAVAFCVNSTNDEMLHAYWGKPNIHGTKRQHEIIETREYGWLADVDQIITRVGAMIAENFFTSAS